MNPVRTVALWLQSFMPATEGWQAASVLISMGISALAVLAVAGGASWLIQKMGVRV